MVTAWKRWIERGIVHMGIASIASFLAFYILFGVSIDLVRGLILMGLLLAAAGWFFNLGANRLWGKDSNSNGDTKKS